MSKYDQDYFLVVKDSSDERLPELSATDNTENRLYRYERQPLGSAPLVFSNGWKADNLQVTAKDTVADILFDGPNCMVRSHVREQLLAYAIPNLAFHPAIYIDDRDERHENYWYFIFTQEFDCWDRATSKYNPKFIEMGGEKAYKVRSYSLDVSLLDNTPLGDRLLFKMGSTVDGKIACHKSIAPIFRGDGKSGVMLKELVRSGF